MSLCGRLGPVFPSSAVQTGRYPGTRKSVDPAYKVARSGAGAAETRWKDKTVSDGILGIDVSKNTLDVSISSCTKVRSKSFANKSDGWHHLLDWLVAQKIERVHACMSPLGAIVSASRVRCMRPVMLSASSIPPRFENSCAASWVATKLTGSMRRAFVSIVKYSSRCRGRRLRRRTVDWASCRQSSWHHRGSDGMEKWQEQRHCRRGDSSPGRCDDLALHAPARSG